MARKDAPGVTISELAELVDCNRTTLNYWKDEHDLFEPTPETADNPKKWGKKYDLHAVQTVLTVKKLKDKGVTFQKIRKVVEQLDERGEDLAGTVLYSDGEGVYQKQSENLAEELAENPGQLHDLEMVVDLEGIEETARDFYRKKAA